MCVCVCFFLSVGRTGGERVPGRGTSDPVSDERSADATERGDENPETGGRRLVRWRPVAFAKRGWQRGQLGHVHQLQITAVSLSGNV